MNFSYFRFQKNAEQLLNVLNENTNMSGITNECDELIKQFQEIEEDIRLETRWCTQGGDEK